MNKVLIIGGCGFIGSHITDTFLSHGVKLKILSRHPERYRKPLKGVEYVFGNYGNVGILKESLKDCDTIIHLAHDTTPKTSMYDPQNEIITDGSYFIKMLELLKEDQKKIIYFSSGGVVYGNPESIPVKENHDRRPISPYGVEKVTLENYLFMYQWIFNIPYLIIRPSNAYGERENYDGSQGIIPIFIKKLLLNEKIEILGDGEVIRDYIYVKDLAEATYQLYKKNINGIYNIGYGVGTSVNEILDIIISKVRPDKKDIKYIEGRKFDVSRIILDISKVTKTITWKPSVPIEHGIESTFKWIKGYLNIK